MNFEKITDWIKGKIKDKTWYCILLAGSSAYVYDNVCLIDDFETMNVRNILFLLWIFILVFPLISEFEFLGMKIKKQVDALAEKQQEKMNEIQSQINSLAFVSNSQQVNVMPSVLPPESVINEFTDKTQDCIFPKSEQKIDREKYTDNDIYLFKIRQNIEISLRLLCKKIGNTQDMNTSQMVGWLVRSHFLSKEISDIIIQVNKIANRGMHGEIVDIKYINFVEKAYEKIVSSINNISFDKLYYMKCSRCQYLGYSTYENVCPICGLVSDDD